MGTTKQITSLVLSQREKAKIPVRQPLQSMMLVKHADLGPAYWSTCPALKEDLLRETNIKELRWLEPDDAALTCHIKANFVKLGKKLGVHMKEAAQLIKNLSPAHLTTLKQGGVVSLSLGGGVASHPLRYDDINISYAHKENLLVSSQGPLTVILNTHVTPELLTERFMREMINRVQNHRKKRGYEVHAYITLHILAQGEMLQAALEKHKHTLEKESLAQLTLHKNAQDFQSALHKMTKRLSSPQFQEHGGAEALLRPCVETILDCTAQVVSYPVPA